MTAPEEWSYSRQGKPMPGYERSDSTPAVVSAADETVAIVGCACRFPKAPDLEAFWRLLRNGESAVTEVPADRWGPTITKHLLHAGSSARYGAFLEQVDGFDADFFGVSPKEAAGMDPQQRLTLE